MNVVLTGLDEQEPAEAMLQPILQMFDPATIALAREIGNPLEIGGAFYPATREIPGHGLCGPIRLLFHWSLHCGVGPYGYEDRYCYRTLHGALTALRDWDGTGDPVGWHRHPTTGRRRDPETGREWIDD